MSRQVRDQASKENNRWKVIAYSIILLATGLLIWSSILINKTFIKTGVVLLPVLFGGLLGTSVLTVLCRKHSSPFWAILFYGMLSGASVPTFLLVASNYYFRDKNIFQEQIDIIKTGNRAKRKSKCRTPYAVVIYSGIEKELIFACEYEMNISQFRRVRLDLAEGLLGFDVIQNKTLVP